MKANLPIQAQRMALVAQAGADAGELYWFLGGRLISRGTLEKPIFWVPEPGKWEMSVVDFRGRSASVTFTVTDGKLAAFRRDNP